MSYFRAPTSNYWSTTLNGAIDSSQTTITLSSVTGLQYPGVIIVDREDSDGTATPTKREVISYTGISGSDLTGCTRGAENSTKRAHSNGAIVEACPTVGMWNDLRDGVNAALSSDGANVHVSNATITGTLNAKTIASPVITGTATIATANIATLTNTSGTITNLVSNQVEPAAGHHLTLGASAASGYYTRVKMLRQNDTTNVQSGNQVILTGWGVKQGEVANFMAETVSFGVTFSTVPIVRKYVNK